MRLNGERDAHLLRRRIASIYMPSRLMIDSNVRTDNYLR